MKERYKQFTVNSSQLTVHGQSLIEVVIALAIAAILAISIISTSLITQKTGKSAGNNTVATKLTQEGIERIRVFRDRNGFEKLTNGCHELHEDSTPDSFNLSLQDCSVHGDGKNGQLITMENTEFYRKILIGDGPSSDEKLITVTVVWDEPSGEQKIENKTYLSSWK